MLNFHISVNEYSNAKYYKRKKGKQDCLSHQILENSAISNKCKQKTNNIHSHFFIQQLPYSVTSQVSGQR
jgi:hypothetical protein